MNLPPGVTLIGELRSDDRIQTLRAQPPHRSEPVIIKIITPDGGYPGANGLTSRLDQWRSISHQSVLRPSHVRGSRERLVFMLPDIPTGSLADRLRMGAVSSLDFGDLCQQACTALGAMHAAGMSHGNLKPSNLLIDLEGNLLISDPLLLHPAGPLYGEPTRDDRVFLAPEVLAGGDPSPAGDQYSLALVLLTLLTRQPPDQAARILASMAVNGGQLHAGRSNGGRSNGGEFLPARAVHTLRKALTVDPENRWPSLDDFNRAFQEALGYQAKPVSELRPNPEPQQAAQPRRRKTGPWRLAAPAMALFLCGMLAVPVYSLGLMDRGLAIIVGQNGPRSTQAIRAAEASPIQVTPTDQSVAMAVQQEEDDSNPATVGDDDPEPTKEQISVSLPPEPSATPTPTTEDSSPVTSQDPIPSPTPTPTDTTDSDGRITPNSCNSDPNHRRYCTPTPAP